MKNNKHDMMAMAPTVTGPQMIAMTVLTLVFLATGVFIAAFCGDFSMRPGQTMEMPATPRAGQP